MRVIIDCLGSAAAGLVLGWLVVLCAGRPVARLRAGAGWALLLALSYLVLSTMLAGAPAGGANLLGIMAGAAIHYGFIAELERKHDGGAA
jgi:hypothetical protein